MTWAMHFSKNGVFRVLRIEPFGVAAGDAAWSGMQTDGDPLQSMHFICALTGNVCAHVYDPALLHRTRKVLC